LRRLAQPVTHGLNACYETGGGWNGMRHRIIGAWLFGLVAVVSAFMTAHVHAQQAGPTTLEYASTELKGFVTAEFRRDAAGCRNICEQRSGCAGFDHSNLNMCRIYAAVASGSMNYSYAAGTRAAIPGYRDPDNLPVQELMPPAEQEAWLYAQFSNVDFYGGDLVPKGLEVHDASICAGACDENLACRAFTFNAEQNRCFLKNGHEFVQAANGVTSGVNFKAKPSQARMELNAEWDLFLLSDLPGHDLGEVPATSYGQCMRQCEGQASCGGFTWVYAGSDRCFLKSGPSLYPVPATKGMVSATKINRDVYPDFIRPTASRD